MMATPRIKFITSKKTGKVIGYDPENSKVAQKQETADKNYKIIKSNPFAFAPVMSNPKKDTTPMVNNDHAPDKFKYSYTNAGVTYDSAKTEAAKSKRDSTAFVPAWEKKYTGFEPPKNNTKFAPEIRLEKPNKHDYDAAATNSYAQAKVLEDKAKMIEHKDPEEAKKLRQQAKEVKEKAASVNFEEDAKKYYDGETKKTIDWYQGESAKDDAYVRLGLEANLEEVKNDAKYSKGAKMAYKILNGDDFDELANVFWQSTPEEKKTFNYLLGKKDYAGLEKYLNAIQPKLTERQADFDFEMDKGDAKQHATFNTLALPFHSAIGGVEAFGKTTYNALKQHLTGEYVPTDQNGSSFRSVRHADAIREGVTGKVGDTAANIFGEGVRPATEFLTSTGLSIAESAASLAAGLATGQPGIAIGAMSASAAGQGAHDSLERGGSTGQAFELGFTNALIEAATEKLPIDNLFNLARKSPKTFKEALINIGKQMGIEASEESVSEIAGNVSDMLIMGDKSQYEQYKQDLMNANPNLSEKQAEQQAFMQFFVKNTVMSGIGGAISGGVMGGGTSIIGKMSSPKTDNKTVKPEAKTTGEVNTEVAEKKPVLLPIFDPKTGEVVGNYADNLKKTAATVAEKANTTASQTAKAEPKLVYPVIVDGQMVNKVDIMDAKERTTQAEAELEKEIKIARRKNAAIAQSADSQDIYAFLKTQNPDADDTDLKNTAKVIYADMQIESGVPLEKIAAPKANAMMKMVSKATGVNIVAQKYLKNGTPVDSAAVYDPKTNTMYINPAVTTSADLLQIVMTHEATHSVQKIQGYQEFQETVLSYAFEGDQSKLQAAMDKKRADYAAKDIILETDEDVKQEITAELFANIVRDQQSFERIFSDKPNMVKRLHQVISDLIQRMKLYLSTAKDIRSESVQKLKELQQAQRMMEDMLEKARKNPRQMDGEAQYSISEDENGKYVQLDRDLFKGVKKEDQPKVLLAYLRNTLGGTNIVTWNPDANGHDMFWEHAKLVQIPDRSTKAQNQAQRKYAHPGRKIYNYDRYSLMAHADELIGISQYDGVESDKDHRHPELAPNGWERRISYAKDGTYEYEMVLKIALGEEVNTLYDIISVKRKKIGSDVRRHSKAEPQSSRNQSSSNTKLSQDNPSVNTNYMQNGKKNTQGSQSMAINGNIDADEFNSWYEERKNSAVDGLISFSRKKAERYTAKALNMAVQEISRDYDLSSQSEQRLKESLKKLETEYLSNEITSKDQAQKEFSIIIKNETGDLHNQNNNTKYFETYWNALEQGAKYDVEKVKRDSEHKVVTVKNVQEYLEDYRYVNDAERYYNKAVRDTLLTNAEQNWANDLRKGLIKESDIPANMNKKDIVKFAEAGAVLDALKKPYEELSKQSRRRFDELAERLIANSDQWNDKKTGLQYQTETQERNIRDIMPKEDADFFEREILRLIHENEAKAQKFLNEYRERVKKMKLTKEESELVQLYGEGIIKEDQIPAECRQKVKDATKEFREIYNELLDMANAVLVNCGYSPVARRKDYFPHFNDSNDAIVKAFKKLGMDIQVDALPTDIAGLTYTFKPGKKYFANFNQRTGKSTIYDAVEGFDRYISGIKDVIYHTEDIQRLRAVDRAIRSKYSDEGVQEQIKEIQNKEIPEIEKDQQIDELLKKGNTQLSNFVNNLTEYTNILAGKKVIGDRGWEEKLGRGVYSVAQAIENNVAANMVVVNPASWMTNFIPLTQATSSVKTKNLLRGIWETVYSNVSDDGFADRSTFLTNRIGSDPLRKNWRQNASNVLGKPMQWIDLFTSESVTRAKYYDLLEKGLSSEEAIIKADRFAADVIADRSVGALPTTFAEKNPVWKAFTMFQVEVNNQYRYLFKDLPRAMREDHEKWLSALIWGLLKYFIGAWIYNEVYEKLVGRRAAFDPIGIINEFVGDLTGYKLPNTIEALQKGGAYRDGFQKEDFQTQKESTGKSIANLGVNIGKELPFVGGLLFGGGRIPMQSAIPDVGKIITTLGDQEISQNKKWEIFLKSGVKPILYSAPFVGMGQVMKSAEGISTVKAGGSFSTENDGSRKLQFPVEQSFSNYAKGTLFGKWALPGSQKYLDGEEKGLSSKKTGVGLRLRETGIPLVEFIGYDRELSGIKGDDEESSSLKKRKYIDSLNLNEEQRKILYDGYNLSDQVKNAPDIAVAHLSKEIQEEAKKANKIGISYKDFDFYYSKMKEIKGSKNSKGNTITHGPGSKKDKTEKYIKGLSLTTKQKNFLYGLIYEEKVLFPVFG